MTTSKHTPGPWRWVDVDGRWELIGANDLVLLDDGSSFGEYAPSLAPNSPDGRLIAAAPELLEACKTLLDASQNKGERTYSDAILLARAAVAKAEGGTEHG